MKPSLRPGVSRVNRIKIGPERTIGFMGEEARTYATPAMIRDIEYTCRDLIMEHAEPARIRSAWRSASGISRPRSWA